MKKIYSIVLIIIAVLIIVCVSGYFIARYYISNNSQYVSLHPRIAQFFGVSKPKITKSPTAGWSTYDNFGIEFQYPNSKTLGFPQEGFSSVSNLSISFNANISNAQPLLVMIQPIQILNLQTGSPEAVTFDQMISKFLSNDKYIVSNKDISVDGMNGKELFYNSATDNKLYHVESDFPLNGNTFISFSADLAAIPQDVFDTLVSTFKIDSSTSIKTDSETGWIFITTVI